MRPLRNLLIVLLIYVGAYVGLRATGHLLIYDGSLFGGSWVTKKSMVDPTTSNKFFQVSNLPAGIFAPLASAEAGLSGRSAFNDTEGKTPLRGSMSKAQINKHLPDKPEMWTVLGGWFEHHKKGSKESFHVVLRTSTDQVATDSAIFEIAHKLAAISASEGDPATEKLAEDQLIDSHTLGAGSTVYRATGGEQGEWAEIVVDDTRTLACISWGMEKEQAE
ncbi:MAG TPA: hypothetical protein VK956_16985 [Verrucomicrobium sp.]|nr:hypothetical protein [Verrucomicrobium sp.]